MEITLEDREIQKLMEIKNVVDDITYERFIVNKPLEVLKYAVRDNDTEFFKDILNENHSYANNKEFLLCYSAVQDKPDCFKLIYERLNGELSRYQQIEVIDRCSPELIDYLQEKNEFSEVISSALMNSVHKNNSEVFNHIVENYKVDQTALINSLEISCRKGNMEFATTLYEKLPDSLQKNMSLRESKFEGKYKITLSDVKEAIESKNSHTSSMDVISKMDTEFRKTVRIKI